MKEQTSLGEQTVKCTRDGCETDIPLVKENLVILRPEVPLLSAKCPECGKTRVLTKEISQGLVDLYFKGELDELSEFEDMGSEGPLMPSKDLSNMVEETLGLLGYTGKVWKPKVKAIVEFVKSASTYQTPQGLHQLLAAWKIDSQHIPMIVQKVFGSLDSQGQIPQYNLPQTAGYQVPNYTGATGAPTVPIGAGYSMAQTPQGQVVVLPPPTPPDTSKQKPGSDDTVIIEEKVKDGKVIGRIIKQKASAQALAPEQKSSTTELASIITLLKEVGVIGNTSKPEPMPPVESPEITKTLEKISSVLATLSNAQPSSRVDRDDHESAATRQYKDELKELNTEIKQMREDGHKAEMSSLRDEINNMRRLVDGAPAKGLSDFQFGLDSKQKNLETVTDVVKSTGDKVIEPLIEMQKMQARLNGMLAVRQLEMEDQVAPGTYISVLAPKQDVTDDEVNNTLQTWRERAGAVHNTGGPE